MPIPLILGGLALAAAGYGAKKVMMLMKITRKQIIITNKLVKYMTILKIN